MSLFLFYMWVDSPPSYAPYPTKSSLKSANSAQRREQDVDTSSEEHAGMGSPSPPPHSAGPPSTASSSSCSFHQDAGRSSQDSRTNVKISKPPANGVQQCLARATAAKAASTAQHSRPEPNGGSDPPPPALPPKTRKAQKVSEAPRVPEHSDRGDSDMDEETYSSSQEKVKKVRPLCS